MSIRRFTAINLAGAVAPMALMLITVPPYLKLLGEARYGVLALVWLVLGYFSFVELGLGKATANQIAKAQHAPVRERAEIFWTALAINAVMGAAAASVLWLVGAYLIGDVLNIPLDFRDEALSALPWMVATFPLALLSSVLNGALEGRNRFLTSNTLQVIGSIVFQTVPLTAAYWLGPGLDVVIPAAVLSRAAMNLPVFIACHTLVIRGGGVVFSMSKVRSLVSFGGWVAVGGILVSVLETFDRFVVGALLGAAAVTHYVLPYQLATRLRVIPDAFSRALFPRFSAQLKDELTLAISALRVLTSVMTPIVLIASFGLPVFMRLWVGATLSNVAVPVGRVFLVGVWVSSLAYVPLSLLQGGGRPEIVAKTRLLVSAPFLVVLYMATTSFGLMGAVTAWVVRVTLEASLLFFRARMVAQAWRTIALPGVLVLAALVLSYVDFPQGLSGVFVVVGAVVFVGISLFLGREELAMLLTPVSKVTSAAPRGG